MTFIKFSRVHASSMLFLFPLFFSQIQFSGKLSLLFKKFPSSSTPSPKKNKQHFHNSLEKNDRTPYPFHITRLRNGKRPRCIFCRHPWTWYTNLGYKYRQQRETFETDVCVAFDNTRNETWEVKRNETKYIFECQTNAEAGDRLRYSSPFFPPTLLPLVSRVPSPRLPSSSKTRLILFSPPPPPVDTTEPALFRASSGLPTAFTILLAALGKEKPVASNGSDKKFSRSPRTGDKVVHSSPPLHGGGIGFSAFHRSPTDFYFDTQRLFFCVDTLDQLVRYSRRGRKREKFAAGSFFSLLFWKTESLWNRIVKMTLLVLQFRACDNFSLFFFFKYRTIFFIPTCGCGLVTIPCLWNEFEIFVTLIDKWNFKC